VQGGAVKINDRPVVDDKAVLTSSDADSGVIKLSLGKKRHVLLKPV
jgi:tyrosyl-tRNA synthetase